MLCGIVVGIFTPSPPKVGAYPQTSLGNCGDRIVRYDFVNTEWGQWSYEEQAAVADGFERWEYVSDRNAEKIVRVIHDDGLDGTAGGVGIRVRFVNIEEAGTLICDASPPRIDLSYRYQSLPGKLAELAAHEMGHALRMRHSGEDDSVNDGREPIMWCYIEQIDVPLTHDDYAHVVKRHSVLTGDPVHANMSFEDGENFDKFWNFSADSWHAYVSGSAPDRGNHFMKFIGASPPGPQEGIGEAQQAVRFTDNEGLFAAPSFRGGAFLKSLENDSAGRAIISTYYRAYGVTLETDQDCIEIHNTNGPTEWTTGPLIAAVPEPNWFFFTTSTFTPSCPIEVCEPNQRDQFGLRIRVRNALHGINNQNSSRFLGMDDVGMRLQ